jgi:hypothetical protein
MTTATRPNFTSLDAARNWVMEERWRDGVTCPCCDQLAKVYRRPLNYGMAHCLFLMYDYFNQPGHERCWLHLPSYLNGRGVVARGGDPTKTRYWGLIVGSGDVREDDSPRVGHWRITEKGVAFVEQRITVPSHALVYNDQCLGFSEEQVLISKCLGKRFDYAKLMATTRRPH